MFHRVVQQIEKYLAKRRSIDEDKDLIAELCRDPYIRCQRDGAKAFDRIRYFTFDLGKLDAKGFGTRFETREMKDTLDESCQPPRFSKDYRCEVTRLLFAALPTQSQSLSEHGYLSQRSAELVRHIRNKSRADPGKLASATLMDQANPGKHRGDDNHQRKRRQL